LIINLDRLEHVTAQFRVLLKTRPDQTSEDILSQVRTAKGVRNLDDTTLWPSDLDSFAVAIGDGNDGSSSSSSIANVNDGNTKSNSRSSSRKKRNKESSPVFAPVSAGSVEEYAAKAKQKKNPGEGENKAEMTLPTKVAGWLSSWGSPASEPDVNDVGGNKKLTAGPQQIVYNRDLICPAGKRITRKLSKMAHSRGVNLKLKRILRGNFFLQKNRCFLLTISY
jgi:hypothetical protein